MARQNPSGAANRDVTRPPGVDTLARTLADGPGSSLPHPLLVGIAREAVEIWRTSGADPTVTATSAVAEVMSRRPQRIVNATGVLLHTNLGRAPLHPEAVEAAATLAGGYGNVELDATTGDRGGRHSYISHMITALTGAEAAIVVNNNAAALVLALAALAAPSGAVVSRGELIEIGGSFRLPDVMTVSGAGLIEVGTTNRTRRSDYEQAAPAAGALLHVHPSNYRIEGFTSSVPMNELTEVARDAGIPLIADIGSGLLDERTPWLPNGPPGWLRGEPGVKQVLDAGADVVLFSGDKLLGGPQSGIAVGSAIHIRAMATHPLMRTFRLDGPTLAALGVTLGLYGAGRGGEIPFWAFASLSTDDLMPRVTAVAAATGGTVVETASTPGGGTVPGADIATPAVRLSGDTDARWRQLLAATPPVLARRIDGDLLLDLRTVDPADDGHLVAALTGSNGRTGRDSVPD